MDIVERLQSIEYDCCGEGQRCNGELMEEAADEIERLREALREIEILEVDPRNSGQMWVETLKEVARKALGEKA